MKNLTISIDDDLHRSARVEAAKAGKSMSRFVSDILESAIRSNPESARESNPQLEAIERFLAGPPLHIAIDGKMPTAEERNERRPRK